MAEESKYTPEALKVQLETSQTRWIAIGLMTLVVTLLSTLTYSCHDSRATDTQTAIATANKQSECVKAGGSWMPVQALNYSNGLAATYEMSCVSHEALPAVMSQNNNILNHFKE